MPYAAREHRRAEQLRWLAARRAAYFAGKRCHFCGGDLVEPTLHHLDPAAKTEHRVWSWSDQRRNAELAKCVPACAGCHRQYHSDQRRQHNHGTAAMYGQGCHCEDCRAYNAARVRSWRSRIKDAPRG